MLYDQEVTVLRPGCGWSIVSAGQQVTGEEGQLCFGMIHSNWAKCECALKETRATSPQGYNAGAKCCTVTYSLIPHD